MGRAGWIRRAAGWWLTLWLLVGCSPPGDEPPARRTLTPTETEQMEQLLALGYLDATEPAGEQTGVTVHDRASAWRGLNLAVSGHAPEAVLFDMDGRVLHRWHGAYGEIWPGSRRHTWYRSERYWRRVHLFPNGDLLAIFDELGMVKLDRDSRVLWRLDEAAHHDVFVQDDGTIFVLTNRRRIEPRINPDEAVAEDFVTVLDADGHVLRRISLLEAMLDSEYAGWLDDLARRKDDIFHTNTLEILDRHVDGQPDAFQPGRALVSIHGLHTIAVVDLEQERVVWAHRGGFLFQHQPTVLPNGHILLFDNLGVPEGSRVLEIDPRSGETVVRYPVEGAEPLFSFCCGSVQPLPNGNTLVTESGRGHALEIDPGGRIVWEYWSPHRVDDPASPGTTKVAQLFEVTRLPSTFPTEWAAGPATPDSSGRP